VEFARVGPTEIEARVWERGSGETMACGSGACAIAVVAHETGRAGRRSWIRFPGGRLEVDRAEDGRVSLTGPAVRVFETAVDPEAMAEALRP
jgi:diaminopimelate epimerase